MVSPFVYPGLKTHVRKLNINASYTLDGLIQRIAALSEYDYSEIFSKKRQRHLVYERDAIISLVLENKDLCRQNVNLCSVARAIGKDHATVLHSKRKVQAAKDGFNPHLEGVYLKLKNRL